MSNVLKINVSSLKTYQGSFETEFNKFSNNAYKTFTSSYLSSCSDRVVKSMYSGLNEIYTKINNGYNNINNWWKSYLNNVTGLENFLSGDTNAVNGIDEPAVIASVYTFLGLEGYENSIDGIFSQTSGDGYSGNFSFDNLSGIIDLNGNFEDSEYVKNLLATGAKLVLSFEATKSTVGLSLIEGLGQFGEALVDFGSLGLTAVSSIGTGLWDGCQAIYGKITGNKWESVTKAMWNDTKAFVAEKHVTDWFDNIYEDTNIGKIIKKYSYGFDTARSIGSGIGYGAGIIVFTIFTAGVGGAVAGGGAVTGSTIATAASSVTAGNLAVTAAAAGTGKYTQNAWADGAGILKGLGTGVAGGAWDGVQYYLGGKISKFNPVGGNFIKDTGSNILNKVLNVGSRVVLDGIDSGLDGFANPAIDAIFKEGYRDTNGEYVEFSDNESFISKWKKLFDASGGMKNVFSNAAIGAGLSFFSEIPDLFKKSKVLEGEIVDKPEYPKQELPPRQDIIDVDGESIGVDYEVLDDDSIKGLPSGDGQIDDVSIKGLPSGDEALSKKGFKGLTDSDLDIDDAVPSKTFDSKDIADVGTSSKKGFRRPSDSDLDIDDAVPSKTFDSKDIADVGTSSKKGFRRPSDSDLDIDDAVSSKTFNPKDIADVGTSSKKGFRRPSDSDLDIDDAVSSKTFNPKDIADSGTSSKKGFKKPSELDPDIETPTPSKVFENSKGGMTTAKPSDLNRGELLQKCYENWEVDGKKLDYKNIEDLLSIAKKDLSEGKKADFGTYLYQKGNYGNTYIPEGYSDIFASSEHESRRWHGSEFDYDYRISLENSKSLTPEESLIFLKELENKLAKKDVPLNFKFYGSNTDALIFYIKKENLQEYIDILEELKTHEDLKNIITKFDEQKPFTGSYGPDSYYGLSLGAIRESNGKLKSSLPTVTMTGYSGQLMQNAFNILLKKYDGDASLINATEMFSEMQKLHQLKQFGEVSSIDVPFWMNKDMYTDMVNK